MNELVIEPGRAEKNYWRDLWRYRELFYFLAWRDIKVRYKQTALGAAWAILQPLLTMALFSLLFGYFLELPSGGDTSYPGLVWYDGILWVSYYSSHEGKTSIYLAKLTVK